MEDAEEDEYGEELDDDEVEEEEEEIEEELVASNYDLRDDWIA